MCGGEGTVIVAPLSVRPIVLAGLPKPSINIHQASQLNEINPHRAIQMHNFSGCIHLQLAGLLGFSVGESLRLFIASFALFFLWSET